MEGACVITDHRFLFTRLGPFCCNGVPLRRVCQAYVIATQTKVDISGVKLPDKLNDAYFRRSTTKKGGADSELFTDSKQVLVVVQL